MAPAVYNNMCTCSVCQSVRYTIDSIFSILKVYGWILDAYIVDFFQNDLWSKLPTSWTELLDKITPEELGLWILNESNGNHVWPLSLQALRQLIRRLEVNRNPHNTPIYVCNSSKWNYEFIENFDGKFSETIIQNELICNNRKLFEKHIKLKKRYEVEKFSEICAKCALLADCKCIVDTGAGMGHLARQLTYKYNFPVICIEQTKYLSDLAKKYDNDFFKTLQRLMPYSSYKFSPYHLCAKIQVENDYAQMKLIENLSDIFMENFQLDNSINNNGFGLIGLHPCGDLAAMLLKIYVEQADVKFISVVGCCYMKITINNNSDTAVGYPLSKHINDKNDTLLNYASLEAACHAVENYCDKIKTGQYNDLKVHAYRALLEMILIKKGGLSMRHGRVGNVKITRDMTFGEYCKLATAKCSGHKQVVNSDIDMVQMNECLNRWRQVVAFEAIRMMLAPLVETVVLLDRFLYLSDHNLNPLLKAKFNPRRSPRNLVLISIKTSN